MARFTQAERLQIDEAKKVRDELQKRTGTNRSYTGMGLPSGTLVDVNRLPQMDIIHLQGSIDNFGHQVYTLEQKLDQLKEIKVKEFQNNDVYEVNKRIERLERKIALLESNSQKNCYSISLKAIAVFNFLVIMAAYGSRFL